MSMRQLAFVGTFLKLLLNKVKLYFYFNEVLSIARQKAIKNTRKNKNTHFVNYKLQHIPLKKAREGAFCIQTEQVLFVDNSVIYQMFNNARIS